MTNAICFGKYPIGSYSDVQIYCKKICSKEEMMECKIISERRMEE